jgi:hypothetical protein
MSASKKNHEAIAQIISNTIESNLSLGRPHAVEAVAVVASMIADHFARDNAYFNRHRFMVACGVSGLEV